MENKDPIDLKKFFTLSVILAKLMSPDYPAMHLNYPLSYAKVWVSESPACLLAQSATIALLSSN